MSFANKYNRGSKFGSIDFSKYHYEAIANLDPERVYVLQAITINKKSKYGEHPIFVVAPDMLVDVPRHMMAIVKEILESPEDVEQIRAGKVGFRPRPFMTKSGNQSFGVEWVDVG